MKTFKIKVTSNGETFTKEIEAEDGIIAMQKWMWWVNFKIGYLNSYTIEVNEKV